MTRARKSRRCRWPKGTTWRLPFGVPRSGAGWTNSVKMRATRPLRHQERPALDGFMVRSKVRCAGSSNVLMASFRQRSSAYSTAGSHGVESGFSDTRSGAEEVCSIPSSEAGRALCAPTSVAWSWRSSAIFRSGSSASLEGEVGQLVQDHPSSKPIDVVATMSSTTASGLSRSGRLVPRSVKPGFKRLAFGRSPCVELGGTRR
jgi:hypothetical protein